MIQHRLVIAKKSMADAAATQRQSCRVTLQQVIAWRAWVQRGAVSVYSGWGGRGVGVVGWIETCRIANRKHPVSPGSEGVNGNPSPGASMDLCNGKGTIFPAVQ